MSDRYRTPQDLAHRMGKRGFRALAEYYAQRAKRQKSPDKREHLARAAEHYRELAKLEEEVGGIPPKPPAPSV
jgi:hypothetical protein